MPSDPLAPLGDLPGVSDGVQRAREAVDALLRHRALRRHAPDVSAESSLRGAWASAALAGDPASLADVRAGRASASPLVQGALRAQSAVPALADTWPRAPRQALARLHALAAADLVEDTDALGRPTGLVAQRLDTLAAVLAATSAPSVVVAGIVHGEIAGLDAFAPASGIVARAAVRLVLVDTGLDPRSLVVVEAGHLELRDAYADALAAYRSESPAGIAQWLVHCVDALVAGARESLAICEALTRG